MKYFPLVWAMLWRRRTRTALTFASIVVAFLLFGLLQAFAAVFNIGTRIAGDGNLQVTHRFGFFQTLPYAYRGQIEALPGIERVNPIQIFPIRYGSQQNTTQPSLALDPRVIAHDPRFLASPEAWKAFQDTRTGLMAGRALAESYGWKVGDHVTVQSPWLKRRDGKEGWEFDVVGLFDFNPEILGEDARAMRAFVRYDYVDEVRGDPGQLNLFFVKAADPAQTTAIAKAIDTLFQNSAYPTKTQTESEQIRRQAEQIGDIGLILTAILSAVFFTLVVVAGNTMMRAFRERIPELAVLKTLGFPNRTVAALVALESLLLCVSAGLCGLLLAWLMLKPLAAAVATFLPLLGMETAAIAWGVALAFGLGVVAALIPAWQSAQLQVVAGLKR